MKRLLKHFISYYLLRFLFIPWIQNTKDGAIMSCQGDLFQFDDSNGNPNSLVYWIETDGWWNYVKYKPGSIYNIDSDRWLTLDQANEQGYFDYYYKNGIDDATPEEIELYNEKLLYKQFAEGMQKAWIKHKIKRLY